MCVSDVFSKNNKTVDKDTMKKRKAREQVLKVAERIVHNEAEKVMDGILLFV